MWKRYWKKFLVFWIQRFYFCVETLLEKDFGFMESKFLCFGVETFIIEKVQRKFYAFSMLFFINKMKTSIHEHVFIYCANKVL